MTKVLFLIDTLYQGGAETLIKDYSLFLDKKKFCVTILCLRRMNTEYEKLLQQHGIKVIFLYDYLPYKPSSIVYKCLFKLVTIFYLDCFLARYIVNKINPDVIHGHLFVLRYLRRLNLKKVKKVFYTCHNEPQKYWHCKTKFSKNEFTDACFLMKNHDIQLIALHDSMREELNSLFNVNNTVVVNNGIDFSRFSGRNLSSRIRQDLNIPKDAFVIGHIGRFVEQKNQLFIIDVFSLLLKKRKDSYLLLVGNGSMKSVIIDKIKTMHLDANIRVLDNRNDVPDLLSAMDVFIFPSIYEGLGIVLIEAQKMGLPCIVSDRVPSAAIISNLVTTLSLGASLDCWTNELCKSAPSKIEYFGLEEWDMKNVVKRLEKMYSCLG